MVCAANHPRSIHIQEWEDHRGKGSLLKPLWWENSGTDQSTNNSMGLKSYRRTNLRDNKVHPHFLVYIGRIVRCFRCRGVVWDKRNLGHSRRLDPVQTVYKLRFEWRNRRPSFLSN